MTSKTTTKAASPKTSSPTTERKTSQQQPRNNSRKHSLNDSVENSVKKSVKKPNRINRQRRLQKQLQALLLERHSRRCIICHHPEREAIEEEFVHWRAPWKLSQDYKLADYRTVYRHARAAGLLLQRRERLHSALDAFVESVDDVTFTGDTILRAMRAYSCIDSHGRWTEIPTQVQFSTSNDGHPSQPSPRTSNVGPDVIDIDDDKEPEKDPEEDEENPPEERVTALDVLNVIRKYSNQAPRSHATACATSPAQACNAPEDQSDELEDDDSDADEESEEDSEEESEEDAENALEEFATSFSTSSKSQSHSDNTACSTSSKSTSRSDTTACAAPPAQALPRDVVRGQNPNDRSPSDRTDCAALPQPSTGAPAQPAAPQKPKPDADGFIWHKRPGYPDQEISEPDAQGRVAYKIHMTTAAAQLPSRETNAQRAAELIYRSVIKKYGNP